MSPYLLQAFIAIEDSRFYQHFGLDPRGLARALWHNLRKGKIVEGGSTITQQLAENEYFIGVSGPARSLGKKIEEAIYAIKLERTYTKDEILERYLNRIYFGHGRFGVEAASQYYFGKSAADLSLSEAAMLAGIPNAPAIYSLVTLTMPMPAETWFLPYGRWDHFRCRRGSQAQMLTPAPPGKTASAIIPPTG